MMKKGLLVCGLLCFTLTGCVGNLFIKRKDGVAINKAYIGKVELSDANLAKGESLRMKVLFNDNYTFNAVCIFKKRYGDESYSELYRNDRYFVENREIYLSSSGTGLISSSVSLFTIKDNNTLIYYGAYSYFGAVTSYTELSLEK